jgi:hypothetical protein
MTDELLGLGRVEKSDLEQSIGGRRDNEINRTPEGWQGFA